MSHDRGCYCGKEFYEYSECSEPACNKKKQNKYTTLVFIGRFQPFHLGHWKVVSQALQCAKEVVIVAGSINQPRSTKNPFTFEERKEMIYAAFPKEKHRIKIVGVMDYPYDDNAWVSAVQKVVDSVKSLGKTGLIGHSKDSSSYYLNIFPDWKDHIEVDNVDNINATDIRKALFDREYSPQKTFDLMNKESSDVLKNIIINNAKIGGAWDNLVIEYAQIQDYKSKSQMKGFNFPSMFVTTDAVLTQSGSILLIKRGRFPFKDCWALPGGYLDSGQRVENNMIKELREETCVKIPEKVLRGSIKARDIFDHPDRDPRGRVITHAFHIDLGYPVESLPKVKGGDDANEARWFKLSEVTSDMMAFDHYHIIKRFIPTY